MSKATVMKKSILFGLCLILSLSSYISAQKRIEIKDNNGKWELFIDGKNTFIKGVGGTNRLDMAAQNNANAFRTWGGSVESIQKDLELARQNKMYIMQGISLTKNSASYLDETYKAKLRAEVRTLAETFKDDPNILSWGIGNEIDLGKEEMTDAWRFVEELALLIKSIDQRHLVSTVIAHSAKALDAVSDYVPHLDYIGINSYGSIDQVEKMVENSTYKGAYMITEWGPTGFWETTSTEWKAPVEQTSEEKRIVYEERYNQYIRSANRCVGSFVFLWGQKEERTPTWFSMFVERGVKGLPLKGEKTPMVEAMQRVWTGQEPAQTAPVTQSFTINNKKAVESVYVEPDTPFQGEVKANDREEKNLTYIWEILKEASVLGFGGSFEPRPDRVGKVSVTQTNNCTLFVSEPGNYRLYVYVLDNTGFVSTANVPFKIKTKEIF
ncbi:hypothetical protein EZS27_032996 [termite gut metagenome]|uniref:Glycoside hydrolase family 2 catalytic domain-containing protein n=1 Tax=termite gut metagenome TaxID=433724 RepID=A0A5J4Q6U4_9ZZZZ